MKQYTDKEKRILDTAAELFARHPFHKVLLSDVARIASVGKGTLYLYFASKDDLYFAVMFRDFSILTDKLRNIADNAETPPDEQLSAIISELVSHLINRVTNLELHGVVMTCPATKEWQDMRGALWALIDGVIQRGMDQGLFDETRPRLSAQYITGLIRSVCLFKPADMDMKAICDHASEFVFRGLGRKQ